MSEYPPGHVLICDGQVPEGWAVMDGVQNAPEHGGSGKEWNPPCRGQWVEKLEDKQEPNQ